MDTATQKLEQLLASLTACMNAVPAPQWVIDHVHNGGTLHDLMDDPQCDTMPVMVLFRAALVAGRALDGTLSPCGTVMIDDSRAAATAPQNTL